MENDVISITGEEPGEETFETSEVDTDQPEKVKVKKGKDLEAIKKKFSSKKEGMNMKKIIMIVLGIIIAAAIVFGAYTIISGGEFKIVSPLGKNGIGSIGETVQNPLTGEYVSKSKAKDWINLRPLAVMVNNHVDARPQSGLIYADLTYEIVAEGGITRLLPFYMSEKPEKIGPVRSTRDYYLVLVKELGDAMIMHIGWSPQALEAIQTWPIRSLGRGGGTFWRENPRNVAIEHTAYVNGVDLAKTALEIGWNGIGKFQVWKFKDEMAGYENAAKANEVSIDFWEKGDYSARFVYDSDANEYVRYMGFDADGNWIAHKDQETGEQVKVKDVLVQFVEERPIVGDLKGRLEYDLVGSGQALVFIDGKVIDATWSKEDMESRTLFYDTNGEEIEFNRGHFWISVVPSRNISQVVYN